LEYIEIWMFIIGIFITFARFLPDMLKQAKIEGCRSFLKQLSSFHAFLLCDLELFCWTFRSGRKVVSSRSSRLASGSLPGHRSLVVRASRYITVTWSTAGSHLPAVWVFGLYRRCFGILISCLLSTLLSLSWRGVLLSLWRIWRSTSFYHCRVSCRWIRALGRLRRFLLLHEWTRFHSSGSCHRCIICRSCKHIFF